MATKRKILSVVGARPTFMKVAPVVAELRRRPETFETVLVHTGQHYDDEMSAVFLEELGVGDPDFDLGVGPGSHAHQTARVMKRLEPVLLETAPDVRARLGRSELDARLRARGRQAGDPSWSYRVGPPQLRPVDAGGDQPCHD